MSAKVWLRKADAQLVEFFPTSLGGYGITWVDLDSPENKNQIINKDSPILFDDDKNFKKSDYIELGKL